MIDRKLLLLLACGLILDCRAKAFGQGGPPVIGDDPGTPGNGNWEINVSCPYVQTPQQTTMDAPLIDSNYGLGDHIELTLETGWLVGRSEGQTWQNGYDNTLVGAKWRFLDEDKNGVDMSVYPQLTFNTSRSLTRTDLVQRGIGFYLPFEIGKTCGKWELDAEAGFQYYQFDRDQWTGGPIIGYRLTDRIELLFEARGMFDQSFRSNDLILDGGLRVDLVNHVQFLFAAGRSVRNDADSTHLYLFAGLGFTF